MRRKPVWAGSSFDAGVCIMSDSAADRDENDGVHDLMIKRQPGVDITDSHSMLYDAESAIR